MYIDYLRLEMFLIVEGSLSYFSLYFSFQAVLVVEGTEFKSHIISLYTIDLVRLILHNINRKRGD